VAAKREYQRVMHAYAPGRSDELSLMAQQQKQISARSSLLRRKDSARILKREQVLKEFLQNQESQVNGAAAEGGFPEKPTRRRRRANPANWRARQERERREFLQKQERDSRRTRSRSCEKQEMRAEASKLKEMMQKRKSLRRPSAQTGKPRFGDRQDTVYAVGKPPMRYREAIHESGYPRGGARGFYEQQKRNSEIYASDAFGRNGGRRKSDQREFASSNRRRRRNRRTADDFGYRAQMQKDLEALPRQRVAGRQHEQEQRKQEQQLIEN